MPGRAGRGEDRLFSLYSLFLSFIFIFLYILGTRKTRINTGFFEGTGGHFGKNRWTSWENWWTFWGKSVDILGNWWTSWEIGGHLGKSVDILGNWWTSWEIGGHLGKLVDILGNRWTSWEIGACLGKLVHVWGNWCMFREP